MEYFLVCVPSLKIPHVKMMSPLQKAKNGA